MMTLGVGLILIGVTVLAYLYREPIAGCVPGIKHGLVGWSTAVGSAILAILQFFQGQESTLTTVFADHPNWTPLIMMGLGLAILVLSWVTPRRDI